MTAKHAATEVSHPLQALRWNLSELRRALQDAAAIGGDPVVLRLHAGHRADVQMLLSGHSGARRQAAWSHSMVGRIHLLRGECAQAALVLDEALETLYDTRWTAFQPWAESLRAEAALECGEPDVAGELLEHAWVLATESRDHCWMATVARGLARLAAARGDDAGAVRWVGEGLRPTPWYLWPCANLLDAGCDVAMPAFPELVTRWAGDLSGLAARGGMREQVIRAHVHRARLGERSALEAARLGASDIDNPALHDLVDRAGAQL